MSLNVFVSFYIVGFFFPWFQEYCFSVIFGCFFTEKPPWRWSKMLFGGFLSHGGTPSHHQFLDRIFHETIQLLCTFIGNPHVIEKMTINH